MIRSWSPVAAACHPAVAAALVFAGEPDAGFAEVAFAGFAEDAADSAVPDEQAAVERLLELFSADCCSVACAAVDFVVAFVHLVVVALWVIPHYFAGAVVFVLFPCFCGWFFPGLLS